MHDCLTILNLFQPTLDIKWRLNASNSDINYTSYIQGKNSDCSRDAQLVKKVSLNNAISEHEEG